MKANKYGSVVNMWQQSGIKTRGLAGLGLLALLALASSADATLVVNTINVNFTSDATQSAQQLNGNSWSSTVAPASYVGDVWNDKSVVGVLQTASNLAYSDSALGLSTRGFTVAGFANSQNSLATPLLLLQGDGYANSPYTLTLTGLPTVPSYDGQRFDLYIASAGTWQGGGVFTIGTQTQSTDSSQKTTWASGVNYVVFTGIQPNGLGQVAVTINPNTTYAFLNGFQLVEVMVPEPSSVALFALGGLLLWFRRSRQQSAR